MANGIRTEETTHTLGPWFAAMGQFDYGNDGSRRVMFGDANGDTYGRIASVDPKQGRVLRGKNATPYNAPDAERDANARLIAAAPDMLQMLIAAYALLAGSYGSQQFEDQCGHMADQLDEVIRKATGNA